MTSQLLNLPVNIPWCQLAVSESMMDVRVGETRYPPPWRSSLAIDVWEPDAEDLPNQPGDRKVTYLKVICSITGYQPTERETWYGYADLDDGSTEFQSIFEEYLACYGVLLNVSVLPLVQAPGLQWDVGGEDLGIYPHIIAFEPKVRDLYQAATETGEVLTASTGRVSTDKTFVHTESSETGIATEQTVEYPMGGAKGSSSMGLTHTWGETDQDSRSFQTDNSRERRETQGTTTQLSQMYNLLTGYHQGTNRATFLMLPRPHTLQPTDYRTFVQGLRYIEGIQEFMLIVSRPAEVPGLCVEASLDLGHFPEDVDFVTPEQEYDTLQVERTWGPIKATNHGIGREKEPIDTVITIDQAGVDGWEFDPRDGQRAVEEIDKLPDDDADGDLVGYGFGVEQPNKLIITGTLLSERWGTNTFHRRYRVHLRRPRRSPTEPHADVTQLLITHRGLNVCFLSGDGCPQVIDPSPFTIDDPGDVILRRNAPMNRESIVDERTIRLDPALITRSVTEQSRGPATAELLRQIRHTMTSSRRQPGRYPEGTVGFLESDYFKKRIQPILSQDRLEQPLSSVDGLPYEVTEAFGEKATIGDVLEMELSRFARGTGLPVEEAARVRRRLLGVRPAPVVEEPAADGDESQDIPDDVQS